MKKVLIVDTVSYERATYIKLYEKILKEKNVVYDLFLWDRDNDKSFEKKDNMFIFHKQCPFGGSKIKKILPMFLYQLKLREIIKKHNYTHLILIDSLAPVMIHDLVLSDYKNKYILDIRDYTYEKYSSYKKIMMKLVNDSCFTCISSKGFKRFLDSSPKYVYSHNISNDEFTEDVCNIENKEQKIVIGFVGSVRYFEENKKLIDSLDSDKFQFKYVGSKVSDCDIEGYCRNNNISNVEINGAYKNEEKPKIYKSIDVINSIYGTSSFEVTTAVPNRFYDALIFKKPIIASKGTYLGELVEECKVGIAIDVYEDDVNELLSDYINNIDVNKLNENMERTLKLVQDEQNAYIKQIGEFLNQN